MSKNSTLICFACALTIGFTVFLRASSSTVDQGFCMLAYFVIMFLLMLRIDSESPPVTPNNDLNKEGKPFADSGY